MGSQDDPPVYSVDDLDEEEDEILEENEQEQEQGLLAIVPSKKPTPIDDTKRVLFQRLWTDEDEIELLKGFLEYTANRGGAQFSSHHNDTTAFYDQVKNKFQLDFNKNQLVEKIRRLKKKYRNVMGKIESGKEYVFKTPHEKATFEISKRIWYEHEKVKNLEEEEENGCSRVKKRAKVVEMATPLVGPGLVEETVRNCLSPILKEVVENVKTNGFSGLGWKGGDKTMEKKWREQELLELEVYSKRIALVQEQVNSMMDEIKKSL